VAQINFVVMAGPERIVEKTVMVQAPRMVQQAPMIVQNQAPMMMQQQVMYQQQPIMGEHAQYMPMEQEYMEQGPYYGAPGPVFPPMDQGPAENWQFSAGAAPQFSNSAATPDFRGQSAGGPMYPGY